MQTSKCDPCQFEFYFANLDTLVSVENRQDDVVIRATRDTFSDRRKLYFIHELAAEGFIPESYGWWSTLTSASWLKVRWIVDTSWLKPNSILTGPGNRFMILTLSGAAILWMAMMAILFLR